MLVKELRQGLRARTFVAVFLGLQLFLALVMLFATTASGVNGAGNVVSRIIFLFFMLAVLVVQPLRGINALFGEIKSSTIDLMVLTRLSARRIVFGKWAAIVGQTLLLFVSIVPYLILRYFFGGMNLFAEMLALSSVLILSVCLTGLSVGVSANRAILIRGLLPLAVAVFFLFSTFGICLDNGFEYLLREFTMQDDEFVAVFFSLLIGAIYIAWTAFGLGVSAIAPTAENHSTLNRVITLIVMALIGLILYLVHADWEAVPFAIGAAALPGIILAFGEKNFLMPRIAEPFVRRGFIGRMVGLILYPCWSAGVFYATLLIGIVYGLGLLAFNRVSSSGFYVPDWSLILSSLIGCLIFPAAVLVFFQKRISNYLGIYIGILAGSFAMMDAMFAIAERTNSQVSLWTFCWLPPVNLCMQGSRFDEAIVLTVSVIFNAIYLGILLIYAISQLSIIRTAEQEAIKLFHSSAKES